LPTFKYQPFASQIFLYIQGLPDGHLTEQKHDNQDESSFHIKIQKYQKQLVYPKCCKFVVEIMAGIYLHIPFCKQACFYCDFHFSVKQDLRTEMVGAIEKELHLRKNYLSGERIETIYFGGGTPSLLNTEEIRKLLKTIHENFSVSDTPEITLEANPDDLTSEKLEQLFRSGVNRLSVGIQTFDDELLKFLNRPHDAKEATQSIRAARDAGFRNISIDLIYGIPGQTMESWKSSIARALVLEPEHISAYSLTVEDRTVFGKWVKSGKLKPVEEDLAAEHLEILLEELAKAGYDHYEISNFARAGYISKHNSNYWRHEKYLGVGPSAHSFNLDTRQANIASNITYLKHLTNDVIPSEVESLTVEEKINDTILTGLRTKWGVDLNHLRKEFSFDLLSIHRPYIERMVVNGLATTIDERLILTKAGRMVADRIAADLFILKSE
jgi:oxygen-independent coproporphyrinogen-3 oxidase